MTEADLIEKQDSSSTVTKEKKKFPVWGIVLIVVLSVAIVAFLGVIIFLKIKIKK